MIEEEILVELRELCSLSARVGSLLGAILSIHNVLLKADSMSDELGPIGREVLKDRLEIIKSILSGCELFLLEFELSSIREDTKKTYSKVEAEAVEEMMIELRKLDS